MDLLSETDREKLTKQLISLFEPIGTTEQFLLIGFGKERRAALIHVQPPGSPDIEVDELLRALVMGEMDEGTTIEF